MSRSEDNTCEYCRADLPRGSATHFCGKECFEANEREAREQAAKRIEQRMHDYALMFPAPHGLLRKS